MIYLSNGIVDPYYGWYLGTEDFEAFIIKKYGSIENAIRRIKHYKMNWVEDDIDISVSFFENHLPAILKKYYSPNFGTQTRIVSYKRRRENWVTNTNKTIQLTVSNTGFQPNELCIFKHNGIQVGSAEIETVVENIVTVQNISGNTSANNILYGETSNCHGNVTRSLNLVENITDDEYVYWTPVSVYDWEHDKNERNKFIQLIDASQTLNVSEELRLALKDQT